jgi:hypothetical protein
MKLTLTERINRMLNAGKVVHMENRTVHEVHLVEALTEDIVFVNVGGNLLYQDTELMTLDEACDAERNLNYLKNHYKI